MGSLRRGSIHPAAEAAAAFIASVAFFLLAAVIPIRGDPIPILLLGAVYVYLVFAAARRWGPLYAVPLAIATGLAFDSFFIPPTRQFGAADWQNWLVVAIYLLLGVLIGIVGARSQRRAERSEQARGVLAEEQAALRRVATLVAEGVPPPDVFAAVSQEVGLLLGVDSTHMARFDPDGTVVGVGSWSEDGTHMSVGTRTSIDRTSITGQVFSTGAPARMDDYGDASDQISALAHGLGINSSVGAPIVVDGQLWGVMIASSKESTSLPPDTESRIAGFTELVATAISNTEARTENLQARSELAASRARIVAATDEERRRVVRDLHDGAQQRLVHTVVTLNLARRALEDEEDGAPALVSEALEHAQAATDEVRELAHGILPSVLTRGGLRAGVGALASRMPVPVDISVSVDRLPPAVEATAYFIVAEALTNVAKHSRADRAVVIAGIEDNTLRVQVRDDGVGGAQRNGNGLTGLEDRLAVLDGRLRVESPVGGGTLVEAAIPIR